MYILYSILPKKKKRLRQVIESVINQRKTVGNATLRYQEVTEDTISIET